MEYLNKHKRISKKGRKTVNSFIDGCWQISEYINLNYDDFKSNKYFKYLLLREQGFKCCYCIRHIKYENTTLEHIVPQNTTSDAELKNYQKNGVEDNVFIWDKNRKIKIQTPPFPHIIAYENLVASCDGRIMIKKACCCNNPRQSKDIIPVFFRINAIADIKYERDGSLTYPEKYAKTVQAVRLEYDTLKFIRKSWANFPIKYTLSDVKTALGNEDLRKTIVAQFKLEINDRQNLAKPVYWQLFWEYRWFYSYFHSRH